MSTLCIVPCGNRKIWDEIPNAGPTQARYVYIGPFAKKCSEYAERFYPDSWCILSAKHGFLYPDDIVPESYNVSFNDRRSNPITTTKLSQQVREKRLDLYGEIVVLGGRSYVEIAVKVFPKKEVHTPLKDCKGIGYMMGRLKTAITRGVPL